MERSDNYLEQPMENSTIQLRDLEEKQRILKDRLLLIGTNLIDIKEQTNTKLLSLKKDVEIIKQNMEKMNSFLEAVSAELSKFAKKEDLEILSKQAKMFRIIE